MLWLYRGNGRGWFAARKRVGGGWNAMRMITATGDLGGDRRGDLLGRRGTGRLRRG